MPDPLSVTDYLIKKVLPTNTPAPKESRVLQITNGVVKYSRRNVFAGKALRVHLWNLKSF